MRAPCFANRRNDRDTETVREPFVCGGAEKNLRILANVFGQIPHQRLNFEKREICTTANVNQHVAGFLQQLTAVEQRALQRGLQRLGCPGLAFRLTESEQTAAV